VEEPAAEPKPSPVSPASILRHLRLVAIALVRLGVLVGLLSVASLLPWHPLPLLEHFRLQLLAGCAVVALGAALLRQGGWIDVVALCALLDLLLVTPGLSGSAPAGPPDGVKVRLLLANVHTENRDHAAVARLIEELSPDIVALVEPDEAWFEALRPALASYPARREVPDAGNFGIALYARGEMKITIEHLGSSLPTLVAQVVLTAPSQAAPLSIVLTHPIPPMSRDSAASQARQLDAIAARLATLPEPRILAGDFNTTPWSRSFARLLRATGLHDSRAGFGVQASFPSNDGVLSLLRIPIDHVLLSPSIGVLDRRLERDIGSDHLPVLVDLLVPRR
jgi:endonuclease/exonuclease/phosphatase (EEP) superfamily protein YafD